MLNFIGEVLLVITRMDRPFTPAHDPHRPVHGMGEDHRRASEAPKAHS